MGKAEKTRLRFSRAEIRKMEKLLQEGNTNLLDENFPQKLSDEFNHARARDKNIKVEQVQRWFFSRMNDHVREAASSPMESNELVIVLDSSPIYPKELSVVPDASLSNSAPESSSDTPKDIGQKVAEKTEWEFEARSSREGAWYDVATFLAHRMDIFGEPEVRVRFEGFGAEEDEWVNVKKAVRARSIPLESTDCRNVAIGDLVLCFRETSDRDAYYDAHVMEIQRKQHDIRGCRCLFDIKYVHDQAEEKVHLRKLCSRPVFKSPNGLSNNKCGTSPAG